MAKAQQALKELQEMLEFQITLVDVVQEHVDLAEAHYFFSAHEETHIISFTL